MGNGENNAIPRQRTKDLVIRAHGAETLILDRRTGTAHCLPAEVTRVWDACTGHNTLAQIATAAGVNEPTAANALGQLMELNLLDAHAGFDRRKLLWRGALLGAGVAAAPVIESVIASPAALAASPIGTVAVTQTCNGPNRLFNFTLTNFPQNTYDIVIYPAGSDTGITGVNVTAPSGTFPSNGALQTASTMPLGQTSFTFLIYISPDVTKVAATPTFSCLTCDGAYGHPPIACT